MTDVNPQDLYQLPPGTPDWIRNHCTGIQLTGCGPECHFDDVTQLLIELVHPAGQSLDAPGLKWMQHLRAKQPLVFPLRPDANRKDALARFRALGLQADLVLVGWAWYFQAVAGHPVLVSPEDWLCPVCSEPFKEDDFGSPLPLSAAEGTIWQAWHRQCFATSLGLDLGGDAR